jgi:hypothetical protein
MTLYNRRFAILARKKKAAGTFANHNLDHHYLLCGGFSPGAPSLKLLRRGVFRWLRLELRYLFTKPAPQVGPEVQKGHPTKPIHAQNNSTAVPSGASPNS